MSGEVIVTSKAAGFALSQALTSTSVGREILLTLERPYQPLLLQIGEHDDNSAKMFRRQLCMMTTSLPCLHDTA